MIEKFKFGVMWIGKYKYTQDLKIDKDRNIFYPWQRHQGHFIKFNEIYDLLKQSPQHCVIGLGVNGQVKLDPNIFLFEGLRGVKFYVSNTTEAVKKFNELQTENFVVGAFHLTC